MANEAHKIKLLVLWDILCKNTDETHALNTESMRRNFLLHKRKHLSADLQKRFVLIKRRAFQSTLFRLIREERGAVRLSITWTLSNVR